jgi:hypothetical protein
MTDEDFWSQLDSDIKENLICCDNLSQKKIDNLVSSNKEYHNEQLSQIISDVIDLDNMDKKELKDLKAFYNVVKSKKAEKETRITNSDNESIRSDEEEEVSLLNNNKSKFIQKKRNRSMSEEEEYSINNTYLETTKEEKYTKLKKPEEPNDYVKRLLHERFDESSTTVEDLWDAIKKNNFGIIKSKDHLKSVLIDLDDKAVVIYSTVSDFVFVNY